jgi:hypothetical protein
VPHTACEGHYTPRAGAVNIGSVTNTREGCSITRNHSARIATSMRHVYTVTACMCVCGNRRVPIECLGISRHFEAFDYILTCHYMSLGQPKLVTA